MVGPLTMREGSAMGSGLGRGRLVGCCLMVVACLVFFAEWSPGGGKEDRRDGSSGGRRVQADVAALEEYEGAELHNLGVA